MEANTKLQDNLPTQVEDEFLKTWTKCNNHKTNQQNRGRVFYRLSPVSFFHPNLHSA